MSTTNWDEFTPVGPDGKPQEKKPTAVDWSQFTPVKPAGFMRRAADQGIKLAQGVVGVPETAVGLADLVTGGAAGKAVEDSGIRFKDAKKIMGEYLSPEQKAADEEVNQAKGFFPTIGAMVKNPSTILGAAMESAPSMISGSAAARGLMKVAPAIGPIAAGAAGEGIVTAGQNAEQVRQETPGGLLPEGSAPILAASGALTGAISLGAGKLANKLGIGDVETMLAAGKLGPVGKEAADAAAKKGIARKIGEGFASEGVLQELPQSYQEQVAQNLAQGKPWDEGAAEAGAQGLMAGGLMGAGGNLASHFAENKGPDPTGAPGATPPPAAPGTPPATPNGPADQNLGFKPGAAAKPSESMGLDPAAGPMSAAAALAVDTAAARQPMGESLTGTDNATMLQRAAQGNSPLQEAIKDRTSDPFSGVTIPEGAASEADRRAYEEAFSRPAPTEFLTLSPDERKSILYGNKEVNDGGQQFTGTKDGDILNGMGTPFKTRFAAARRAHMMGKEWGIEPVADGFVARWKGPANEGSTASGPASVGTGQAPQNLAQPSPGSDQLQPSKAEPAPDTQQSGAQSAPAPVAVQGVGSGSSSGNDTTKPQIPAGNNAQATTSAPAAPAAGLPAAGTPAVQAAGVNPSVVPAPFKSLLSAKSSKVILDDGNGRVLYEVKVTPEFRNKNFVNGRMPSVKGLELVPKENVTKNPSDNGWVLIDNRAQIASREAEFSPKPQSDSVTALQPQGATREPQAQETVTPEPRSEAPAAGQSPFVPPLVTGMIQAATGSASSVKDRITNVRYAPTDGATNSILFDLDGKPMSAVLRGRNADAVLMGNNAESDKGWAARALLDGDAQESKPPKKQNALQKRIQKDQQARADYFTPGNIVKSYSGHDRVIGYTPPFKDGGNWSVRVQSVVKQGDKWVNDPKDNRERQHSTPPDAKELASGPVFRNPVQPQGATSEPQADQAQQAEAQRPQEPAAAIQPVAQAPVAPAVKIKGPSKDGAQAHAAGRADFAAGKPRVPPSYLTSVSKKRDWMNGWDTAAQADQESGSKALPNDVATTKGLGEQLAELNAELERQGAVQNANTRAQRDAIRMEIAKQDFHDILKAVDDNLDVAEELNRAFKYAGDEPKANTIARILKKRGITTEYQARWTERLMAEEVDTASVEQPGTKPEAVVKVPEAIGAAIQDQMEKQKRRVMRLRGEESGPGLNLEQKAAAQTKTKAAEATLRQMRTSVFDAEDAAIKAIETGKASEFEKHADLFPAANDAIRAMLGQNDELDAETRAYEDGLTAQTRADDVKKLVDAAKKQDKEPAAPKQPSAAELRAQADLNNALADLGDIFSKPFKAHITPEQEQKLLPVLTRVLDAAFRLGYAKFKDAAKFALDKISAALGADVADALTLGHLQGAYIAMAGGKQGSEGIMDVAKITSKDEILAHTAMTDAERNPAPSDGALETAGNSADTGEKEPQNGPSIVGEQDPQALENVASAKNGGAQGGGRVRGSRSGRGAGGKQNDSGIDEPGVSGPRSGGSGSTSVRAPTPRKRGKRGGLGASGTGSDGIGLPGERGPESVDPADLFNQPTEPVSANNIQAVNFRITPELRLGKGGENEKFRDNIAAIRTLKAIEAEGRRATSAEQSILARYVGWGGLANAFPAPESKQWKDEWKARGAELAELLTKKEYDLARRSTLDSHYTSETIVSGMWDAARRMGFKGGMALESSMGSGNFLGLIPQDMAGSTRFIGIEYDSLTSRIAEHLYPQETVLNAGLQNVPLPDKAFDLNIGNPPFGDQSLRFQFKPEFNRVSIHNQFFLAGIDSLKPGGVQMNVVSRYLLDAMDKTTRTMLAKKAKLVAAIRLPDTAFKENARTSVVTDIVILQKLSNAESSEMMRAFDAAAIPFKADKNATPQKNAEEKAAHAALAAKVPSWVEVGKMSDPLGGDPMTVNNWFIEHPEMILGTLERSGKMQFKNDITVRPHDADLSGLLAEAISRLPENIMQSDRGAIAASLERHKAMSDGLRISLSGQEAGSIVVTKDGTLEQVVERETPEGEYELAKRLLTPESPWSESLYQDANGNWYTITAKLDEAGNKVKVVKNGKATNLNVYERNVFASTADISKGLLLGPKRYERLVKLVGLRDLMVAQINLETEDAPTAEMEGNRALLAKAYNDFVESHGPISRQDNSSLVSNMPDGALVQALELEYRKAITPIQAQKLGEKARPESATPAPILAERVIPRYEPPTKAATPADALSISLSETGRVDLARMAALLGKTEEEVTAEMFDRAEKPLIFKDPELGQWVTRNDYLTGQVKKKLHAAQAAHLERNIAELEAVQPEPWGAENVTVLLGSTFVPPKIYEDFLQHVTGTPARVLFSPATNSYAVMPSGSATAEKVDEFGADGIRIADMVSEILNSRSIRITKTNSDGKEVFDEERTALALIKAKQIRNEFTDWVFMDSDRRRTLVDLFNERFNTRVNRQHDGSHLTLPGKVPDAILKMRRHQLNTIWRGISERFMLIDHVVGAGKTFTAIARVMERRRMGLSRKPAIIVPNHMVEQFTADVYRLYPGAKVLAAGQKDFEKQRRRKLFAKIASGDWDVVIIPHSSFGFIGIAPETEERYLEREIEIAEQAIADAWDEAGEQDTGKGRKPFNVKQAERLRDKLTARMAGIKGRDKKDRLLTFEQMGIDDLTVDEAHEFKNLFYSTRLTNVKGMGNPSGSQKAFDLYSKVRVLRESPSGTVTFMTGTPISNSAVEMFNMMRYLAADELKELGLEHFDAWRSQFVSTDPGWEPTETGRLKEVNRLGRSWSNMRSLMDLYYSFTDSVSNDDIKKAYSEDNNGEKFPIPDVMGGDRRSVVVQPTEAQISLLNQTIQDFDSLPNISDPYERNKERLRLMDRARKLSLDVRAAVRGHDSKEKGGKLEKIADEAARVYKKWGAEKGTQLIFLDRSVPKAQGDDKIIKEYDALIAERNKALAADDEEALQKVADSLEKFDANEIEELRTAQAGGWNAYQQIKDNLIAAGIPANEIRFIQEANNDAQKQALFDAVNAGEVRILIGSTPRMGAGTNVQKRLVGLHHADVTWKPSDIEQREGRIIRQGNLFATPRIDGAPNPKFRPDFEVEILAYATERTIDAKMWSLNAAKLKTINAIRNYDGSFSMDFEDEDSVSMAEMAALASGNPLLMERVKLTSDIDKLDLLKRQHQRKMWGFKGRLDDAERAIQRAPEQHESMKRRADEAAAGQRELDASMDARSVTIEGADFKTYSEAAKAVHDAVERQQAGDPNGKVSIKVGERRLTSLNGALDAVSDALGDSAPFLGEIAGVQYIGRTAFAREISKAATEALAGMSDSGGSKVIATGKLRGFTFEASLEKNGYGSTHVELALVDSNGRTVGTRSSRTQSSDDDKFVTSSLTKPLSELDDSVHPETFMYLARKALEDAAKAEKEIPDLREKAARPFSGAQELAEKTERLNQVISLLSVDHVSAPVAQDGDLPMASADNALILSAQEFKNNFLTEPNFTDGFVVTTVGGGRFYNQPNRPFSTRQEAADWIASQAPAFSRATPFYSELARQIEAANINTAPVNFSPAARAQSVEAVERVVSSIADAWENGPRVVVAFDMQDPRIPERIRLEDQKQRSGGARGAPEGFYYDGTAYLMASQLKTPNDTARVLFHEALGHFGLRNVFGKELKPILQQIVTMRRAQVDAKVKEYGLRGVQNLDRLTAAEEVLAEMAQTTPNIGFVTRAVAAIRTWLRKNVPGFKAMALTDAEIIANYILPARGWVERGQGGSEKSGGTAFSRDTNQAVTNPNDVVGNQGGRSADDSTSGDPLKWTHASQGRSALHRGKTLLATVRPLGIGGFSAQLKTGQKWDVSDQAQQVTEQSSRWFKTHAKAVAAIEEKLNESPAPTSDGAPVPSREKAADQTQTEAFKRWFGDSKVVDAGGKPLVVYHGTNGDITAFDASKVKGRFPNSEGFYFTSKPLHASVYADSINNAAEDFNPNSRFIKPAAEGGNVMPAYVSLQNPKILTVSAWGTLESRVDGDGGAQVRAAREAGHDGVIVKREAGDEWDGMLVIAFRPEQIKSATGNNGDFDPGNDDIRFSRSTTVNDMKQKATEAVNDFVSTPGKLNWWHKTVGTQYNLAQRSPEFRRVFNAVQGFINDVSFFATEAADLAPNILPKLETWKDIAKSPVSAQDTKAIAAPIFEGTLLWARDEDGMPVRMEDADDEARAGVVWTNAELQSMFNLTGERQQDGTWSGQIGLYHEFRKAVNKSLGNLAISDMLTFVGKDADLIRSAVLDSDNVVEAGRRLGEHLAAMARIMPDRRDSLLATANKVMEKTTRAVDLMARGYAPLSRFGQYTLDVVDADGERVYFSLFESRLDAERMAKQMAAEYPDASISRGTLSQESYKLFAGVSPETVALFGNMLGLENEEAFQDYIKLSKSNRSAMKRLLHRKGIAGYSEDAGRVLAGFIYSNARQTSQNLHTGEMNEAAEAIPKRQGELKDAAVRLVDYIKNPQEEAQRIRGLLFAQYIGGSVASALVNLTQPVTMTLPWLSQFGGIAKAGTQMAAALKAASKDATGDAVLDAALKRAEEDGTVSPQEVHDLMRQSQGRGSLRSGDGTKAGDAIAKGQNLLSRIEFAWGKLFSAAEQMNRRVTFIAAYRTAVEQGMADPDAFARRAIAETQGIYNKGNKPKWARGAVGSTLFTFKQYSISYVEMMHRMATRGGPEGRRAALYGLAILVLLSGVGGAPGADDLDDLISGIMQSLGYNFDSKAARKRFLAEYLGDGGAEFVERGISGLPGVPIDVSGRLGLGNLIPGTGLMTRKEDHTRDVAELAGPAGDLFARGFEAGGKLLKGNVMGPTGAVATIAPRAAANLFQAADMAKTDMYRDRAGKKVVDTDAYDALAKAIGFQPNAVKRVQDNAIEVQRMVGLSRIREAEIADKWAVGLFEKDMDKVAEAQNDMAQWNADNPETPIRIKFQQITKRLANMNMSKAERIAKTAPTELRNQVRQALQSP